MARIAPVPAQPAIQSDEEAGREAQEYKNLVAEITQIDEEEKRKIAEVKDDFAKRRMPLVVQRDEKRERVQAWAEATRAGRKTINFPNGRKARWRYPSNRALIVLGNLPTIVRLLLRRENWDKYLRIELQSNNVKADLKELQKVPGLRRGLKIDDTEYFSIG